MTHRDTKLADELISAFRKVERVQGVVYIDDFGTWLLSRPSSKLDKNRLVALMRFLSPPLASNSSKTRGELAKHLGSREVIELTPGFLGQIRYQMRRLGDGKSLSKLVRSGIQPAKALQGSPWKKTLKSCERRLSELEDGSFAQAGLWPYFDVEPIEACPELMRNLASLYDPKMALRVKCAVDSLRGPDPSRAPQVLALMESFRSTVNRVVQVRSARRRAIPLYDALTSLPIATKARVNRLAELLREHLDIDSHLVPPNDALHLELGAFIHDDLPEAASRLVSAAIKNIDLIGPTSLVEVSRETVWSVAAAQFSAGSFQLKFPPNRSDKINQSQAKTVHKFSPSALKKVWPEVIKHEGVFYTLPTSIGALEGNVSARLFKENIMWVADTLAAGQIRRYLRALDFFIANPIEGMDPKTSEFVERFGGRSDWIAATAVILVNGTVAPVKSVLTLSAYEDARWLAPLAQKFASQTPSERPDTFLAIANALNLSDSALDRYLFWREWAGRGATFSAPLQKYLSLEEDEERQIQALDREIKNNDSPELASRVQTLRDPERKRLRKANAQARALKAFERSLDELRRQAMANFCSQISRMALQRVLGKAIDQDAPDHVDQIPLLFGSSDVDMNLARRFVDDVMQGRDLQNRPMNQRWLERMEGVFNTSVWVQGLDFETTIKGEKIHFKTELNPLHVLKMGTYFDTCLTLVEGFNAASTLANAIDVNKAVIYGYNKSGKVVARKLIAVTDKGKLLGYYTYAHQEREAVHQALTRALQSWGQTCALTLATAGAPASIHDAFWYDDGAETWISPELDKELDRSLRAELAYVAGFDNWSSWRTCVELRVWPWTERALAQLWGYSPQKAPEASEELPPRMVRVDRFPEMFELESSVFRVFHDCQNHLPADPSHINAFCEALIATQRRESEEIWPPIGSVSAAFALGDFATLVPFFEALIQHAYDARLECLVDDHQDCQKNFVQSAAAILQFAGLRDGFHAASLKRLWNDKHPIIQAVVLELSTLEPLPALAKQLRSAHRSAPSPKLAYALSLLDDQASGWAVSESELSYIVQPNRTQELLHSTCGQRPEYPRAVYPSYWYLLRAWLDGDKLRDPILQELDAVPGLAGYQAFLPHLRPSQLHTALKRAAVNLEPAEYEALLTFTWAECRGSILDPAFRNEMVSGIKSDSDSYRLQLDYMCRNTPKLEDINSDRMRWLESEAQSQL